ncbi:hypothetical protein Esti_000366 [Eimeria stiedai]
MASSEEEREALDGGVEAGKRRKRLRKLLDDDDLQMKRRGTSGGISTAAASDMPDTPDDAAASAAREDQQEINLCSGLDDNLMALLLPEGFASTPEASRGSQDQAASSENEGGVLLRCSVERAPSAVCTPGSEPSARDLLPVPSSAAEAPQLTVQNVIASGRRVMVTGAQSEEAALRAARLLVKMLQAVLGPSPSSAVENSGEKPAALIDVAASKHTEGKGDEEKDDSPSTSEALRSSEQRAAESRGVRKPGEEALACKSSRCSSSIRLTQFAVENIVATADCGLPVRLEGLAFDHKEFCSYEPELFAGLVYRYSPTPSLKAVLLIFVSGKVVITGCKSASEVQEVYSSFYPVLLKYHT